MTLAELATTFGPTAGFLIYLYLNRPKAAEKGDDATALLRSINDRLIVIETLLKVPK